MAPVTAENGEEGEAEEEDEQAEEEAIVKALQVVSISVLTMLSSFLTLP